MSIIDEDYFELIDENERLKSEVSMLNETISLLTAELKKHTEKTAVITETPVVPVTSEKSNKKVCDCRSELHGGNHYPWCESLKKFVEQPKIEASKIEVPKVTKPCSCRIESRVSGTHYHWCDSLAK